MRIFIHCQRTVPWPAGISGFLEFKDALVTNRKCGTCRFYEAGTQQTHGWCRNPAYPRRDDVALLRLDELGCRSGWGKDFWEARRAEHSSTGVSVQPSAEAAHLVPVPIGTGIAAHNPRALPVMTMPVATATPSAPATRQRDAQELPTTANPLANAPKDGTMKTSLPLSGHPELNDQGVPIRSQKRTSVAEAHRRALERREQERRNKEARDQARAKDVTARGTATPEPLLTVHPPGPLPTPPAPDRGLFNFNETTQPQMRGQASVAPNNGGAASQPAEIATSPTHGLSIEQQESLAPTMPRNPQGVTSFPRTTPTREPEDMIISAVEAVQQEISTPRQRPSGTIPTQVEQRPSLRRFGGITERPGNAERTGSQHPGVPAQENAPPVTPPSPARYWDQPGTGKGFDPIRQERVASEHRPQGREESRPVQVGRQAVGQGGKPVPHRTIRPLGAPAISETMPGETREVSSPLVQPAPVTEARLPISAPPPVEPISRQIDEALLRQLEADWLAQQLEAHAGQRCGTCRFFQAAETGRGACNCSFAPVYRRQTNAEGLGCLSALGTWWSAPDEGWLERTERRPRRATPLLDTLLRERDAVEPLHAAPERRRGTR